jgi:hypothetical protein
MQLAGLLYGSKLLRFVGFPCPEVLGPEATESEIKTLMLELLVECFFGTSIDYQHLRDVYVPALERIIDHIVRDTVVNRLGLPRWLLAPLSWRYAQVKRDYATFEELTGRVLAARASGND